MPDISMCRGKNDISKCPIRDTCYRYKATPDRFQSYIERMPYDFEKKSCEYEYKRK
jgi:hypothetical protein